MDGSNQPPSPFANDDEAPVFVVRGEQVWACWLSGKPPVLLGAADQVRSAMDKFIHGEGGAAAASAAGSDPAAPTSGPQGSGDRQPVVSRADPRHEISIIGKVHTGIGVRDVTILDLSEQGCRFHDRFCNLRTDMPVSIRIGPVGPVRSTVRWRRGEYVGIQFDNPLYPSVMEHIRQHFDLGK